MVAERFVNKIICKNFIKSENADISNFINC